MKHNTQIKNGRPWYRRKPKLFLAFLLLLLAVIVFRISLPAIVLRFANRQLQEMSEYTGNIAGIDIRLYRGAYIIRNIAIEKTNEDAKKDRDTIPFFSSPRIDLSVDWNSLFKGSLVGKIKLEEPVINYTSEIHEDKEIQQDTTDFIELIESLMPLTINRFEITKGQIHYIDPVAEPRIDIAITDLYVTASNLTNVVDRTEVLPAHITAAASAYSGSFTLDVKLNPLKMNPTFELTAELKEMDLTKINDLFKSYGNFDVEKGFFSVYAEFAAKEGKFGGYVKPFVNDFKLKKYKENEEFKQRIWEILIGTAMKILENPKTDQVATRIPINGEFNDTEIEIFDAIHYVLRNAFVQALRPAIENSISVYHLDADKDNTLLEKIFGDNEDEKNADKKESKKTRKK